MRDNFSKSVKLELFKRVNGRCSNPDCNAPTTGPKSNASKSVSVGDAAHITAASAGGPRFDRSLTNKERKSIENAIWLCKICAKLIDSDEEKYSVSVIHNWKNLSEARADREIGRPSIEVELSRKNQITSTVRNLLKIQEDRLNSLDSRLNLSISFKNGEPFYEIFPKETMSFSMSFRSPDKDLAKRFNEFFDYGSPLDVRVDELRIEGSKLLEEITKTSNSGRLTLNGRAVIGRLTLEGEISDGTFFSYSDSVVLRHGRKAVVCETESTISPIKIRFEISIGANKKNTGRVQFGLDFAKWEGHKISALPDFYCIRFLFGEEKFTRLRVNCVVNEKPLFSGNIIRDKLVGEALNVRNTVVFINQIVELSKHYKIDPVFTGLRSLSEEQISKIQFIYEVIKNNGKDLVVKNERIFANMTLNKSEFNSERFKSLKGLSDMTIVEQSDVLEIFGVSVKTGYLTCKAVNFSLITEIDLEKSNDGDEIKLEWVRTDTSQFFMTLTDSPPK